MNPEPSEATRVPDAPGAGLSPRNSRNTSSSVRPGEFCASSCAEAAARAVACVETLTTLPTSRPVNCAKSSANGDSGCGPGTGGAAAPASGWVGALGAAALSCDGAAPVAVPGAARAPPDCVDAGAAHAGTAIMANSAHKAAIGRRRKALTRFSYCLEARNCSVPQDENTPPERRARRDPPSCGDSLVPAIRGAEGWADWSAGLSVPVDMKWRCEWQA